MFRSLRALIIIVSTTACSCGAPAKPSTDTAESKVRANPAKAEPGDPVLLKVCKAFDDVAAEGKADQAHGLMARAAVRATELGVTEAQLEALGPQPPQLLASIRARGNPPECAAFVAYLAALP